MTPDFSRSVDASIVAVAERLVQDTIATLTTATSPMRKPPDVDSFALVA